MIAINPRHFLHVTQHFVKIYNKKSSGREEERKLQLPIYNMMSKAVARRVARHRNKVQDLRYTDKYLQGKSMPSDYATRHAAHIEDGTEEE